MRGVAIVRRSRRSSLLKLNATVAVAVLAIGAAGCSPREPLSDEGAGVSAAALNSNPQITNFGVYAQNSATLRDRAVLTGGDVGVQVKGTGGYGRLTMPDGPKWSYVLTVYTNAYNAPAWSSNMSPAVQP